MPETFRPPGAPRSVGVPARSRPPAFRRRARRVPPSVASPCALVSSSIPGGHCAGAPPLPIPNREVKPGCADGTAPQCGRVGGRRLFFPWRPCRGTSPGAGALLLRVPHAGKGASAGDHHTSRGTFVFGRRLWRSRRSLDWSLGLCQKLSGVNITDECFKGNRRQESGAQTDVSDFPTANSFFPFFLTSSLEKHHFYICLIINCL